MSVASPDDFLGSPETRLNRIEHLLVDLDLELDAHEIAMIGVGPLEVLFHQGHEDLLWPEIERLARSDPRFRRALASTWAYDSPRYDDRQALLRELGESAVPDSI